MRRIGRPFLTGQTRTSLRNGTGVLTLAIRFIGPTIALEMTVDTFGDITVVVSYLWVHRVAPSAFSVLKSKRLFVTTVVVIRTQWFITWNMRSTELPRRLSHLTRFRTMRYQNLEYVKPILNKN